MSAAYNKYRTPGTRYDRILTAIENGEPDEAIMARENARNATTRNG